MVAPGAWSRRFGLLLLLIVVAGATLRVTYVLTVTRGDHRYYDALFYEQEARSVATGHGWNQPLLEALDPPVIQPTAEHPPATVVALLPAGLVGDADARDLAMRFTMVAIGCGTIALVGLIGRSVAGPGVGLLAAAVAALDPNLWMNDGIMMSEALATLLAAALVLLAYQAWRGNRSWRVAAGLGLLCGVGALTRSELTFFLPLLAIPALVAGARHSVPAAGARAGLRPVALSVVCFGLVLAPWSLYNLSRFDSPTTVSSAFGVTLLAANCDAVYYGPNIGFTGILEPACVPPNDGTEVSVHDAQLRHQGLGYLSHHAGRLPVVAAARVGRAFYLFKVDQTIHYTHPEGRPLWAEWLGAVATWILLPLAMLGWPRLRRRGTPTWPLVAPVVAVLASFVIVAGLPRYRAAAEPSLIVLASVAAVHYGRRLAGPSRRDDGRPTDAPAPQPEPEPAPS